MRNNKSWIEVFLFFLSIVFFSFLYGFLSNRYNFFPSRFINGALKEATALIDYKPAHLSQAVYDRSGVRSVKPDAVQPGLTLITTYWPDFDWRAGIKLIDLTGNTVHKWDVNPKRFWPQDPHRASNESLYVHGSYLYPNGDVLLNIEYMGLVKIDSCGWVKWKLDYDTHHSISLDDDGNIWVPGNVPRFRHNPEDAKLLKQFPGLYGTLNEDHVLKVSPSGDILKDINMLKVVYDNGFQRYIPKIAKRFTGDIMHLNDVEILKKNMAAEYPLFEHGDIVVSLRYLQLIIVLDPETEKVKWYTTDPFIEQHDPDFIGDGWITIFNNNRDFTWDGAMLGGSSIVKIKPHTGEAKTIYPTGLSEPFYTQFGGKFQLLENGNFLITEAQTGRIFESASSGETVWEWIHQRYNKDQVTEVLEGSRYSLSSEHVKEWSCNPSN